MLYYGYEIRTETEKILIDTENPRKAQLPRIFVSFLDFSFNVSYFLFSPEKLIVQEILTCGKRANNKENYDGSYVPHTVHSKIEAEICKYCTQNYSTGKTGVILFHYP